MDAPGLFGWSPKCAYLASQGTPSLSADHLGWGQRAHFRWGRRMHPMGTRDRAPSGPLTRVLAIVRGALGLVARSAFALVRVFLAGCALLAVLMVPVWLWAHVVIDALDIKTVDDLTQGE